MSEPSSNPPSPVPLPNPLATASLWLGIVSVVLFGLVPILKAPVFWVPSILAIIFGHVALRKIGGSFVPVAGRRAARVGKWIGWTMTVFVPLAVLLVPVNRNFAEKVAITKAINNCRQIITALRIYSGGNQGNYPDTLLWGGRGGSSNDVFRELLKPQPPDPRSRSQVWSKPVYDNEMIFELPLSPFRPDGNVGKRPECLEAVKAGENGWAMTWNLTDSRRGDVPLVYEAPAIATWPPKWNAERSGHGKPGYAWSGGKVIIGMNDSSVALYPLEKTVGKDLSLKPKPDGKPVFPPADRDDKEHPYSVLDVAR